MFSVCGVVVFTFDVGVAALPAFVPAAPVCEVAGALLTLGALEGVAVEGLPVVDEEARCRDCGATGTLA